LAGGLFKKKTEDRLANRKLIILYYIIKFKKDLDKLKELVIEKA